MFKNPRVQQIADKASSHKRCAYHYATNTCILAFSDLSTVVCIYIYTHVYIYNGDIGINNKYTYAYKNSYTHT